MEREINISRRKFLGAAAGGCGAAAALSWPASRAIGGNAAARAEGEHRHDPVHAARPHLGGARRDRSPVRVRARAGGARGDGLQDRSSSPATTRAPQILGRQITPAEIRTILDDNGLEAKGNHGSIPGTLTEAAIDTFKANCQIALTSARSTSAPAATRPAAASRPTGTPRSSAGTRSATSPRPRGSWASTPTTTTARTTSCSTAGRSTRSAARRARRGSAWTSTSSEIKKSGHDRLHGDGHLLGARRAAPLPDVHQPGRRRGREDLRPGRPRGEEHAPVPALPRQGRQAHGRSAGRRRRLHDGARSAPATSTSRRSSTGSAPTARTIRCTSRTTLPAARPTRASRWRSPQVSYNNMAALGAVGS